MSRARGTRRSKAVALFLPLFLVLLFIPMAAQLQENRQQAIPIQAAEDIELERRWGPLAPVVRAVGSFAEALSGGGGDEVGLEAEFGYTSVEGESVVFRGSMSGVGGLLAGVYVKPSLGDFRKLKLFDDATGREGEIWVRPIIKVKVLGDVPERWEFKVDVKAVHGGRLVSRQTLAQAGEGAPPSIIRMDKAAVKGGQLYRLLKAKAQSGPVARAEKLCFTADYQGLMWFPGSPEPVAKRLEDVNLGCFDFTVHATGDFQMIVDRNVTIAPLAEVVSEAGVGGWTPQATTQTITLTKTTATTITKTTIIGGKTITLTQTLTKTQLQTITKVKTLWKTKTITTSVTIQQNVDRTVTVTKTVTKYVPVNYILGGVTLTLTWPYSEFVFIAG